MWRKGKIYFFKPRESVFDSNTIIIDDEDLMIVDPGTESKKYFEEILSETGNSPEDVEKVFNTHAHYDHFQGNKYFPEADKIAFKPDSSIISRKTEERVKEISKEENISTGELTFRVIHTPGHSRGSCSLHLNDSLLICGDLVFANGSYGRIDLEGGSIKELKSSLEKLKDLKFNYLLPGHREIGDKSSVANALERIRF